jgi:hypothetical protein
MSNSSLVVFLYAGIIPVFDGVFQMKMPGARPGIPFLSTGVRAALTMTLYYALLPISHHVVS